MKLILASTSPRRKDILTKFGIKFTAVKPKADEDEIQNNPENNPYKIATLLAYVKAKSVADKRKEGLVLGSDTIVVLPLSEVVKKLKSRNDHIKAAAADYLDRISNIDSRFSNKNPKKDFCFGDEVLGKPKNKKDALKMLSMLSGSTHRVLTGVAFIDAATGNSIVTYEESFITFKRIGIKRLKEYVDNNHVLDKAGSYAIQEGADPFIKCTKGSYYNIVGLPIELVRKVLSKI